MIFLQLLLQILQGVHSIPFGAAYVFMPGHVLHFSEIVMFEPIGNGACTDLSHVCKSGFIAFYHGFDSGHAAD